MPQVWRIGQNAPKAVDPLGDEFRVAIFLTNAQADRAEKVAIETGMGDLQAWCQASLRRLINEIDMEISSPIIPTIRTRMPNSGAEINAELDIPDDPAFYREWAGIVDEQAALPGAVGQHEIPEIEPELVPEAGEFDFSEDSVFVKHMNQVLEHLRAGRRPSEAEVATLYREIEQIGRTTMQSPELPKRLVRLLYRLSLETQVLITEVHPRMGLDLTVVTLVRQLQSAVGKVMEG